MKKLLIIMSLGLTCSRIHAIPACDGIDLAELKERFIREVHNEQDYKAFKPSKWKICVRTLATTLYKQEKDKADQIKEEKAETDKSDGDENKEAPSEPDDSKKDTKEENENKPEENKFSPLETDIAHHYLRRIYPNYPSP
ncbi:MAG: hypothetical protein ACOH2E_01645 [Candidatus Paracaedibacter sp.]